MTLLPPLKSLLTGVAGAAIVAAFVFTPVSVDFDQDHFVFKASAALASDDSSDDDSSDDDGNDDDSSGDDGNDDDSGDDDSSDDSSSSSDDSGNDDSGSHDSNDDSSGSSSSNDDSNDDHNPSTRPLQLSVFLDSLQNGSTIAKAETEGSNVEIVYSDGWKEEISHGRYELTDPNGNTILSRPANARDIARLNSVF